MKTTKFTQDQKIDNLQHQLDMMNRSDAVFRGCVHRQFEMIAGDMATLATMATKEDLRSMEARIEESVATKVGLYDLESNLTAILGKIAEKVGVSM